MDEGVLVVHHPPARREQVAVGVLGAKEAAPEELLLGGVDPRGGIGAVGRIVHEVEPVGGVAGRVPEGGGGPGEVVVPAALHDVEHGRGVAWVLPIGDHHAGVDVPGRSQTGIGIDRIEGIPGPAEQGERARELGRHRSSRSRVHRPRRATLRHRRRVLPLGLVPELVVVVPNAHFLVHVVLLDEAVLDRRAVQPHHVVGADLRFTQQVGNAVVAEGKRVVVGVPVAVFGFLGPEGVGQDEVGEGVGVGLPHLEEVAAIVPTAAKAPCHLVAPRSAGAVLHVAAGVHLGRIVSGPLDAEIFDGRLEHVVVDGPADVEGQGRVAPDHHAEGPLLGQASEVRKRQRLLGPGCGRIGVVGVAELVQRGDRVEVPRDQDPTLVRIGPLPLESP